MCYSAKENQHLVAMCQVSDAKGDTVEYPMAVLSLPFTDQGNTYFFKDDYNLVCNTETQNTTGGSKVIHFEACISQHVCIHYPV